MSILPRVILTEEDYLKVRPDHRREDYRVDIARASAKAPKEVQQEVFKLARERGLDDLTFQQVVMLTREVMLVHYQSELRKVTS